MAAPVPAEDVAAGASDPTSTPRRQPSRPGGGTRTDHVITTVTAVAVGIAVAVAWFFTH